MRKKYIFLFSHLSAETFSRQTKKGGVHGKYQS